MKMTPTFYIRSLSQMNSASTTYEADDVFGLCDLSYAKRDALNSNPNKTDGDSPVQILGIADQKIVGQQTLFAVNVKANARIYIAYAGSGLFVHEDFRKSMLGVDLITRPVELSSDGIALGCGISQMALPVHLMFDYLCFSMPRLMWVFKSRSIVEKKIGRSFLSPILIGFADILLSVLATGFRVIGFFKTRGLAVEEVYNADESIANLLKGGGEQFSCEHTAAWLNWQLEHSFSEDERSSQKMFVIKDSSGSLLGFFMFKVRFHETASQRGYKNILLGSLMEWQSADQQKLSHSTLALLATLAMKKCGVDAVEICTNENATIKFLRRLFFPQIGELSFVIRATDSSPLRKHAGWDQPKNWRLRPSYGDNGLS
ncbi:MAG: hypothetical protein PHO37_05445 [Kiritimatiellae bacterium]|nr:hypothetical protein [Kiritimatiellia bacterium]